MSLRIARVFGLLALGALVATPTQAGTIGLVADNGCQSFAGVYFCDADIQPTGTGVFDPFMRVFRDNAQKDGTLANTSSGWNTDADTGLPESNDAPKTWNSALALADLAVVVEDGTGDVAAGSYYVFTVDINQEGKPGATDSLLSLWHFELYNCDTNDYTSLSECTSFLDLFDTEWVDFNYRNHTGSGSGDINVFVPIAGFTGEFIALQDGWGAPATYVDNDGYQEWAARLGESGGTTTTVTPTTTATPTTTVTPTTTDTVPEPALLSLLGVGLASAAYRLRRKA
jgi:hypothetical protein